MNSAKHSIWPVVITIILLTGIAVNSSAQTKLQKVSFPYNTANVTKTLYVRSNPAPAVCNLGPVPIINKAELNVMVDWKADYIATPATQYTVNITINAYSTFSGTSGLIDTYNESLVVNRDNPQAYVSFYFTDIHPTVNRFTATVNYVAASGSTAVQQVIQTEVYYTEEFDYDVSNTTTTAVSAAPSVTASADKQWLFKWNEKVNCTPAPNYEFQLLRLYNTDPLKTTETNITADVDWSRALTIETGNSTQQLALSITEGTGYYVWRVRAIGNQYPGGIADNRNWGKDWSTTGTVSGNGKVITSNIIPYLFFYTQFDAEKNWQYTRTFVEGDAVKKGQVSIGETINYANGLLMPQQQQTRIKSKQKKLVTQTIADYVGRPALTTLPTPVTDSMMGYMNGFIKNTAATPANYSAADFDADNNYNAPAVFNAAAPGPGYYYSTANTIETNVSSAQGYPFSRTLYMNDGTSKPKEQSGPGDKHRLGNTVANRHTTRNYIASAADAELINIFGDEAPAASSVQKSITTDANGSASISYISKEGKTLATCLASPTPANLTALPSAATATPLAISFVVNNNTAYKNNGLRAFKSIVLTEQTQLTFNYDVLQNVYADVCANFCATCDYKITVRVIDNDNPSTDAMTAFTKVVSPTSGSFGGCAGQTVTAVIPPVTLPAGSYTIERVVEWSQANPAVLPAGSTTYLEKFLKDKEATLLTKLNGTATAVVVDGNNSYYAPTTNVSMTTIKNYLTQTLPNNNTPLTEPDLNALYNYLNVPANLRLPNATEPKTQNVVVKLGYGVCDTIVIPVLACEDDNCPLPDINGKYDFEKYFIDWYLQKHPDAQNVTINNLFNNIPFAFAPGDFNIIVSNMLNAAKIAPTCTPYNCKSLLAAWQGVFMSSEGNFADFPPVDLNNQTSGDFNSANVKFTKNYLDLFIKSAEYTPSVGSKYSGKGYQIRGINNNLGGFGNTNLGYKFHPYAYVKYDETSAKCEACERAYLAELDCIAATQASYTGCYSPSANFTAYFNATSSNGYPTAEYAIQKTNPVNSVIYFLYPKNDFLNCLASLNNCTPPAGGSVNTTNAINNMIDSCKKSCSEREKTFLTSVTDAWHATGKQVQTDIYNLVPGVLTPYTFNNTLHTYAPGTDVSSATIYCQTQNLVASCKSLCVVPVTGNMATGNYSLGGTSANQQALANVMYGVIEVKLPVSGVCPAGGYSSTGTTTQAVTTTYYITQLNEKLQELRATAPLNGFYWDYLGFLKTSYGTAIVSTGCAATDYVLVHPDIPSFFDYNTSTSKLRYHFNRNTNGTSPNKPFVTLLPMITDPDLHAADTHTESFLDAFSGATACPDDFIPYMGETTFSPHKQTVANPNISGLLRLMDVYYSSTFYNTPVTNTSSAVHYQNYEGFRCKDNPYWISNLCASFNTAITSTCTAICYRVVPPKEVKITDPEFVEGGIVLQALSCAQDNAKLLAGIISQQISNLIVAQNTRIKNNYDNACGLSFDDHLTVNYNIKYHHYTLYYYDRAGNLVKTVPPEGVLQGTTSRAVHPAHRLVTEYAYNSYGQMVRQKTPDGGETKFWYDSKGRLRFSQNAKQQPLDKMSYSKYDELGRIVETGEIVQTPLIAQTEVNNLYYPNQGSGTDITVTVYSTPYIPVRSYLYYGDQEYLQNRVSYTFTDQDGNPATLNDYVSTVYSYDPHGNVEWLVQSLPDLGNNSIAYEYDLVSGNVIKVKYNEYAEDKLHQRYSYDAEKRLESVESTKDERFWERDASYSYYLHGPLKRMELGHDKLQGMDYLYTLQGWLKAINHANTANDPGKDATAATPNALYARDVYSQMLGYYAGDFVSSTTNYNSQTSNPYYLPALTGKDLYNGNISTWTSRFDEKAMSGIPTFTNKANAVGKTFAYDELNRLMQANYLVQSNTNVWGLTSQYKEDFTYDANGNIKTLQRKDNTGAGIDGLTYNYPMAGSFITSNRLQYVDDAISTPANSTDIEDQNAGNYTYDFIGNLTKDIKEGINSIEWNLYGKISKILKTDGTQLNYLYDAAGNRVYKKTTASNGSIFTSATYYVRDASGNPMALYERKVVANPGNGNFIEKYNLTEQPLYGSSRIGGRTIPEGSIEKSQEIPTANTVGEPMNFPSLNTYAPYQRTLNRKRYELNDHLGNVRAVISDYKLPVDDGTYVNGVKQNSTPDGIRDFYVPNLVNLTDFYSFGSPMPGRNFSSTPSYRYGFNGQEKDDEIKGNGNSLEFKFRIYDPRLGKFLSVDPLAHMFPGWSPYSAFFCNPIFWTDPTGMAPEPPEEFNVERGSGKITKISDKGGSETDYYNVGSTNSKGEFTTDKTFTIDRPVEGGNINSFRIEETKNSTTSTFNIPGTETTGFILEPAGPSTKTANQDKRIPEGTYNVESYSSDKYPNSFRISNQDVSKSRKILIHSGNTGADTEGCLIPGSTKSLGTVGSSKPKLGELRNYINDKGADKIKLNINDATKK